MPKFFKFVLLLVAAVLAAPVAAVTSGWTQYSPAEFAKTQAAGKTIVVDVHADWCPTCRAQQPTLDALRGERRLKNVVFVKVDFDTQKDFLRQYRIPRQSTILVFKGTRETARSIAETRPAELRAAVLGGL